MNRIEFLKRIDEEIDLDERTIILDRITDLPLVIGCAYDEDKWKYYETRERGGHFIIKEFDNEEEAYDYIYKILLEIQDDV